MDLSPSPVPSSSVVRPLLNLRCSPVLPSFTGPRTCLAHQSGSQFLCRSPVTAPTSFAGHPSVHGSTDLPRSPVRFPVPLSFTGPRTCVVHCSPLRQSFIGSPFLCHSPVLISFRSQVHRPVWFTVSHFLRSSSVPTSPIHKYPEGARCVYVPTSLTSYSIPPSLI
jgi:hypothetical protein